MGRRGREGNEEPGVTAAPAASRSVDARIGPTVLLLSAALLCFEVVLLRLFAIETFHHLTYMAVGVALLGLATSGTAFVLLRHRAAGIERSVFGVLTVITPVAMVAAPWLAHLPDYDPTQLLWDHRQWVALAWVYLALAAPFLLGGGAIVLALEIARDRVGRVYAWNLVGSGAGTLLALPLLSLARPDHALAATSLPAALAAATVLVGARRSAARGAAALALVVLTVTVTARPPWSLEVNPFKALPQVAAYPDARQVAESWDATGWAVAVASPAVHHAPGLSLAYRGTLPPQIGLFVDGESAGASNRSEGGGHPDYLGWLPSAAAYRFGAAGSVLVLGAGGGTEVALARAHGARRVVAVELVRPLVAAASRADLGAATLGAPGVTVVAGDARAFAARGEERFDRIVLPTTGVFNATAAGLLSGAEDYLNTTEAYASYLERLAPGGVLAVTRWVRTPPRDNVRVILTMAEALRGREGVDVGVSLVFVRSWATGTTLAKPSGFSAGEVEAIRQFARTRLFDVDWPPVVGPPAEPYNALPEPVFVDAARAAAAGPAASAAFADDYPFLVDPRTDDRPYFGRFLRVGSLPGLWRGGPGDWLPVAEWGTLALVATLVQSLLLAVVLMGLPVLVLGRAEGDAAMPVGRLAAYFASIGFGYLFLEMAAIQRLALILGHPVYAAGVTLAALLVFSGVGSAASDRVGPSRAWVACAVVVGLALLSAALAPAAGSLMVRPASVRVAAALVVVAAAGVAMGLPFPLGMRSLAWGRGGVAWGWAANGVASVAGAALAVLIAQELGGRALLGLGACCYAVAALVSRSSPAESVELRTSL